MVTRNTEPEAARHVALRNDLAATFTRELRESGVRAPRAVALTLANRAVHLVVLHRLLPEVPA